MKTRSSTILLKYNNQDATEVITNDLEGFSWVDSANGQADTISLTLNNQSMRWLKGFFPADTDYIKMWIKVTHWRWMKDIRKKYCGKFQVDDFSAGGVPNTVDIKGISVPIHTGFHKTMRTKTYKNTSVKNILQDIAKRAGVKLVFDSENIKIKEISQTATSDMSFAFSLCSDYGLSMKVYNGKIVVYDQTKYEKKDPAYTIDFSELGESGAYSYHRTLANMYDGVKLQYSGSDGKNVTYKYVIPKKKGNNMLMISGSAESHADAERKAKAGLMAKLREVDVITLKLMGDPKYTSCNNLKLTGFGKLNGIYFIDEASHEKSSKYITTLKCHKVVTQIG